MSPATVFNPVLPPLSDPTLPFTTSFNTDAIFPAVSSWKTKFSSPYSSLYGYHANPHLPAKTGITQEGDVNRSSSKFERDKA